MIDYDAFRASQAASRDRGSTARRRHRSVRRTDRRRFRGRHHRVGHDPHRPEWLDPGDERRQLAGSQHRDDHRPGRRRVPRRRRRRRRGVVRRHRESRPSGATTGGSRDGGHRWRRRAPGVRSRCASKVVEIAAHLLEASPEDLDVDDGRVSVRGTPAAQDDARRGRGTSPTCTPKELPPGCAARSRGAGRAITHRRPRGRTRATSARARSTRHRARHDPALRRQRGLRRDDQPDHRRGPDRRRRRAGHRRGAVRALRLRRATATRSRTTFLDYLLPTATDVPMIEYGHIETRLGPPRRAQGHGGGRRDRSPPAVFNAVADALAPLGVRAHRPAAHPRRHRRRHFGRRERLIRSEGPEPRPLHWRTTRASRPGSRTPAIRGHRERELPSLSWCRRAEDQPRSRPADRQRRSRPAA